MSVVTTINNYLDDAYLDEGPYLTSHAQGNQGMQARIVINALESLAFQSQIEIENFLNAVALQAEITIANALFENAFQASITINAEKYLAMQVLVDIEDVLKNVAMQSQITIQDSLFANGFQSLLTIDADNQAAMQSLREIKDRLKNQGMQAEIIINALLAKGFEVRVDKYPTSTCQSGAGYLEMDYLESPYLIDIWCTRPGMQALIQIVDFLVPKGMQSEITIVDFLKPVSFQSKIQIVDFKRPVGMQADAVRTTNIGMQSLATIYNTKNLRILCSFPSRGLTNTNWTANSTAAGDFSVQNLDTDIVEQVWRSNSVVTGLQLVCDTGLAQGVFLDTMAILNHNMTRSANISLIGSNDPTFSVVGITIPIQSRSNNIFYISPTLPTSGYRYWRFDIDDATNPDGFVQIGTIIFGASEIFQGECFVDEIEFELKDYASTVRTEGFTHVSNSRSQKRRVRLDFRFLDSNRRNFGILRSMFENERTTHKCLWIPTPSETNQEVTAKFAAFAKLSQIPVERHNNKGPDADYVSFTIEVDEGR
jgi:hypothetical protein